MYCIELFTKDGRYALGYIYERDSHICFGGNTENRKKYPSLEWAKKEKIHSDFKVKYIDIGEVG